MILAAPHRSVVLLGDGLLCSVGQRGGAPIGAATGLDGNILIMNMINVREHREDTRKDLEGLKN